MLEKVFEKANSIDILIIVVTSLAVVSFWRGVWGLMDVYLFPEDPTLSFLISIIIGLAMLLVIAVYQKKKK
jgi:hypothetical protein